MLSICASLVMKRAKVLLLEIGNSEAKCWDCEMCRRRETIKVSWGGCLHEIKNVETKEFLSEKYFRRMRVILKSKLNDGNIIWTINSWTVSLTRHASRIIEWKKQELQLLDRKKRKVLTMCGASHPKAAVDKLHIRRSRENHRLISVEVNVVLEMSSLNNYLISAEEKFLRKKCEEQKWRKRAQEKESVHQNDKSNYESKREEWN